MAKWFRAALAGGIVVAVYWVYSLTIGPWIEPSPSYADGVSGPEIDPTKPLIDTRSLFAEDAWQNGPLCKSIETDRGVLLYEQFGRGEDGSINLNPVTLVYLQDAAAQSTPPPLAGQPDPRLSSAIILDAPEGAELQSDQLNVARMQLGKVVTGQLNGPITIRSSELAPPHRRLWMETRDIRLDGRRIWTPHAVRFQYGRSRGSGSNLLIRTTQPDKEEGGSTMFGDVESIELVKLDELIVAVKDSSGLPFTSEPTNIAGPKPPPQPLHVTCRGSLMFAVDPMTATLHDDVQVVRRNPNLPPDRLLCQQLKLRFGQTEEPSVVAERASDSPSQPADRTEQAAGGKADESSGGWKIVGVEAIGAGRSAVVLEAPSREAFATGEVLAYDTVTRRLLLRQSQGDAVLRYRDFDVQCPQVDYVMAAERNKLGHLWARGPGRMSGRMKGQNDEPFEARWQRMLQIEPRTDHHVLSAYEQVTLQIAAGQSGSFSAETLHLYMRQTPQPTPDGKTRYRTQPLRLVASESVAFDSPELSGTARELNVFFETPRATPLTGSAAEATSNGLAANELGPNRLGLGAGLEAPIAAGEDGDRDTVRKFHVDGEKMELRVITPTVGRPTLDDVTVAGDVKVKQTRLAEKDQNPLLMFGDLLQISSVSRDRNRLTVRGRPARIAMGLINIQGGEIIFDQQTNQVTVDGIGQITVPSDDQQPVETTTISWRRGMEFNGEVAEFHGGVVVDGARRDKKRQRMQYHGEAAAATATLSERVDFRNRKRPQGLQLKRLELDDGVYFENQLSDPSGALASHEKMRTDNLDANLISGDFRIVGPGWGSTARFSRDRFVRTPGDKQAPLKRQREPRLTYLHVSFQDGVRGNLLERQAQFDGGVVAVQGPISRWGDTLDPNRRGGLGPRGVELRCDQLRVVDISTNDEPIIELVATGNTIVENEMYGAAAQRLSFTESKNLLVLDGDSTYDAKLKVYGANPKSAVAKRIMFWTDTYDFDVDRVQSIQFGSFGKPAKSTPQPLRTGRLR